MHWFRSRQVALKIRIGELAFIEYILSKAEAMCNKRILIEFTKIWPEKIGLLFTILILADGVCV